ncbi:MAG: hypothetical protein PVF70_02320 [Anaerolineales bacterium]|jgi:hypothetical protein
MKTSKRIGLAIVCLLLLTACDAEGGHGLFEQAGGARTYYESLDLRTPRRSLETFLEAFRRDDFMTVYLVLAPDAHWGWGMKLSLLQYDLVFQRDFTDEIFEEVTLFTNGIKGVDHFGCGWYMFDQVMLAASRHNAFLIDLTKEVTIVDTRPAETAHGDSAIDIIANLGGVDGEVIFRFVQMASGNWKVYQVILPGADEAIVPWAIPTPVIERIEAYANIETPCTDRPPAPAVEIPGEPFVIAKPTCGIPRGGDGTPGTVLTLTGGGFRPNTETEIWWKDWLGNAFRSRVEGERVTIMTDEAGRFQIEVAIPYRSLPPSVSDDPLPWQIGAVQEIEVSEP